MSVRATLVADKHCGRTLPYLLWLVLGADGRSRDTRLHHAGDGRSRMRHHDAGRVRILKLTGALDAGLDWQGYPLLPERVLAALRPA